MMQKGAASALAFASILVVSLVVVSGGCGDYGPVTLASQDAGGNPEDLRARGVGEACSEGVRCRTGLECKDARCAPGRVLEEGDTCIISAECKDGLYCAPTRKCTRGGVRIVGDSCSSEAECVAGSRCNAVGLSAECQAEGALDIGGACKTGTECFGGLFCTAGVCSAPPPTTINPPVAVSAFTGVKCVDEVGAGPVRAYFRIPRGQDDGDFFRLPFPNDARRKNGRIDLTGFPTPGADVLGYDLVDRWARYVEESATGFSAYPSIVMRFGGTPDLNTLKLTGVVRMVDVTTGSAGGDVAIAWGATNTQTKYVCPNAITARPAQGVPLEQGHTYALLITNGAKGPGGSAIEVAADLNVVLGAADPGAPLSDAWRSYAPLRTWAAAKAFDLVSLVNATVFTVGKHTDFVGKLATAIAAAPPPAVSGWVRCGAGPSPCPQAEGPRACGGANPAFDELHALVTLPSWQKTGAPDAAGVVLGDIALDAAGAPVAQPPTQVCLSLTVPKNGAMPASGWPLAIFAHDTGGSFRSHVDDGVAARFASADAGAAAVAVLGFDQVAHGTRRGASTARPAALWYATSNPSSMRGQGLQAAADILALVRLAPTFTLPAASSPTAAEIRFGSVVLVGHGQGATAVALAGPRAPSTVKGVVLGGVGASFLDTVISKRNPVDFANVAPVVLGESVLTAAHPVLSMFQNALDPVDPLDHAASLVTAPVTQARHTFVVYGRGDTHTPGVTQVAYTSAARLGIAAHPVSVTSPDDLGQPILPVPVGANVASFTAIVRQYDRSNYDGHLVMLLSSDATRDVDRFVADIALAKTPMVGR